MANLAQLPQKTGNTGVNGTGKTQANPTPSSSVGGAYLCGLVLLGFLVPLPLVALIFTAAIYIASPFPASIAPHQLSNWIACIAGFIITLVLWLFVAIFFTSFSSVENAIPVSGSHLKNHFLTVKAAFEALKGQQGNGITESSGTPASQTVAENNGVPASQSVTGNRSIVLKEVESYVSELEGLLTARDLRWIAGTGYLRAWNLVHRAEEAMIGLEPTEEVIREALYDASCLNGSPIDARDSALQTLGMALQNLNPSAMGYLDLIAPENPSLKNGGAGIQGNDPSKQKQPPTTDVTANQAKLAVDPLASKGISPAGIQDPSAINGTLTTDSTTVLIARNALRDVRRVINEYRDGLWEGLVTLRNQLMGTTLFAGFGAYILLCFAIIAGALPASIKAAIVFYLIGALVGLFGRLYAEAQADQATEDYNLTLARIIVTPVLGGLAAVGGVLLATLLSLTLTKASVLPTLEASYDLNKNALGVVIAAVFGLTPNLFINTLQSKAQNLLGQLQQTSASNQGKSGGKGQSKGA